MRTNERRGQRRWRQAWLGTWIADIMPLVWRQSMWGAAFDGAQHVDQHVDQHADRTNRAEGTTSSVDSIDHGVYHRVGPADVDLGNVGAEEK
jgi:hypothetical protein